MELIEGTTVANVIPCRAVQFQGLTELLKDTCFGKSSMYSAVDGWKSEVDGNKER